MSKNITVLSKIVNQQALEAVTSKLNNNVWAVASRSSPNAEKLKDGAIQRMSVSPDRYNLHVKSNSDKVGFYKRPELTERASAFLTINSLPWDNYEHRNKVARIYYPEIKHTQRHPANKNNGRHWVIEFESYGTYKSPLQFFTSATQDTFSKHTVRIGSLSSAVKYCEVMGWGYDILYPHQKWHTKKNYSDNFMWKGKPEEEVAYD